LKFFLFIVISLSLFTTSLSAKSFYIQLMSVHQEDALFNVSYRLKELGLKMSVAKHKDWYRVYTGPFQTQTSALNSLKKVQKHLAKDAFIVNISLNKKKNKIQTAKENIVIPKTKNIIVTQNTTIQEPQSIVNVKIIDELPTQEKEEEKLPEIAVFDKESSLDIINEQSKSNFFVGVNAGIVIYDIEKIDKVGNVPLDIDLQNRGVSFELEAGYYFNENIYMTLNYENSALDDTEFHTFFTSLGYKLGSLGYISPYVSVLGGVNIMSWKNYPISSIHIDDVAISLTPGAQLGTEIPISQNVVINLFYRYWLVNHKTRVSTNAGEVEVYHKNENSLNLGLRYKF